MIEIFLIGVWLGFGMGAAAVLLVLFFRSISVTCGEYDKNRPEVNKRAFLF